MQSLPLRPFQEAALSLLSAPQRLHVILVAPTGSGKSRIFEEALCGGEFQRAVLVSPLVALHRQHAENLRRRGISVRIGLEKESGGSRPAARAGAGTPGPGPRARTWIVSPETLDTDRARAVMGEFAPDLVVIDECHCVWDWGARFRPTFARLPELAALPHVRKSLWLTATLPVEARRMLQRRLSDYGTVVEQGRFSLPERLRLDLRRIPLEERPGELIKELQSSRQPVIVFSVTRQGAERIRNLCVGMRIEAVTYHAGLSREERLAVERGIAAGRIRVVIATSAFGMGMDFPALGKAILWQAPLSLLDLAQAVGRVARGESGGEALCLWHPDDFRLLQWSVGSDARRARQLLETRRFLEGSGCHRERLERGFRPMPEPSLAEGEASPCIDRLDPTRPCSRCESRLLVRA